MSTSRSPETRPFSALFDWRPTPFRLLPSTASPEGGDGGEGHEGEGGTGGDGGTGDGGHKPFSQMSAQERADHYGYPTETLVKDMTPGQQAGYYRAKSDKLEARAKVPGLSKAEIASLQERAARADALEEELMSDSERAVAEARQDATTTEGQKWLTKVVSAEVRGQLRAANITDATEIAEIVDTLNLSKLVTDEGDDVDPDLVARALGRLTGATGATSTTTRPGPSASGQGKRTPTGGKPGDAGRAEAAKRFAKQKAAAGAQT